MARVRLLTGLIKPQMRDQGDPTCLSDDPIGFHHTFDFGFNSGIKNGASEDFQNQIFTMQNVSGQVPMESLGSEVKPSAKTLPWSSGPFRQFYAHDTFHSNHQQSTQNALYDTNPAIISSNYGWNYSQNVPDGTHLPSFAPVPAFAESYDEQQMWSLESSTSNSTSYTNFADLSQNKDIFEPSSPSTPRSQSDEKDSTRGFSSVSVPTLPSSEVDSPPTRKSSQIPSAESENGDSISCSNCSTNNTSLWRRTKDGLPVCNACGLFTRLHGIPRPLSLKTDVVKKRKRERVAGSSTSGKVGGTRSRASRHVARVPSISEHRV